MLHRLSLLLCFAFWALSLPAQLTIKITAVPPNTPLGDSIYIAGTFNNWNPGNAAFIVRTQPDGVRQITLNPPVGTVQFKFTRGSWATVEGNAQGGQLPNRVVPYNGQPRTEEVSILSWEDLAGNNPGTSTAAANVRILSDNFQMPQLSRSRRIWLYLPPDYNSSNKRYPVLYMHDGQNVFDARTSFSGEWRVDEALNSLFDNGDSGVIVVAIDNGGANRINEYSPWIHPQYGGGQGAAYLRFLVETLKPYIDANYRTRPEREHTGIMGSSMGGLISLYGAIEHQDVFGKAGVFSPSFWFSSQCFAHVSATGKRASMRIYLLAGQPEGNGSVVADLNVMYNTLRQAGFEESELFRITHPDGAHSEWYWAREFPAAYQWLYSNAPTTQITVPAPNYQITLAPNPADSMIYVQSSTAWQAPGYRIFHADGREVRPYQTLQQSAIQVNDLPQGVYIIIFYEQNQVIDSQKVMIHK